MTNIPMPPTEILMGHEDPSIRLLDHLPASLADDAAELYLSALADKLIPVYGNGWRARKALSNGFNCRMCITALVKDRLIGILGIQTDSAEFMNVTLGGLRQLYGTAGSLWRMALLSVLHHAPLTGEAYVDGVAVAQDYRGRGVGTRLIRALDAWATGQGLSMLSLEVVDANPRAEKLYRHLGFQAVREQTVWPFSTLLGFRSSTVMIKPLI